MQARGVNITLTERINSSSNTCKRDEDIMMLGTFNETMALVQNGMKLGS